MKLSLATRHCADNDSSREAACVAKGTEEHKSGRKERTKR